MDTEKKLIKVSLPITAPSGKIRVKKREILNEHGVPGRTRQDPMTQKCYVEWQIGYDVPINDSAKVEHTTLTSKTFTGSNGKTKYLYELSEYIKYFYDWGIISKDELLSIKDILENLPMDAHFDRHPDMAIRRRHFQTREINELEFLYTVVESPLVVHKFDQYEVITEIEIKEQQHAVGTQPMLYLCFPITELDEGADLLGRVARQKEEATFTFDQSKKVLLLEMLKIFGMLTSRHNTDVVSIIDLILGEWGDDSE